MAATKLPNQATLRSDNYKSALWSTKNNLHVSKTQNHGYHAAAREKRLAHVVCIRIHFYRSYASQTREESATT